MSAVGGVAWPVVKPSYSYYQEVDHFLIVTASPEVFYTSCNTNMLIIPVIAFLYFLKYV